MIQGSFLSRLGAQTPLDPGVVLITDPRWSEALDYLDKQARVIGFDLETFGREKAADGLNAFKGEIRLIQVGLENGWSMIADLGSAFDDRTKRLQDLQPFLSILGRRIQTDLVVCGQELIFDSLYCRVKFGWIIPRIRDCKILSQVLWAGVGTKTKPRMQHSLKAIAKRVLGLEISKEEQREDWGGKLNNKHLNYGTKDVQLPLQLIPKLISKLQAEGCLVSAIIECEAVAAFCEMEFWGQPVRKDRLHTTAEAYRKAWKAAISLFEKDFPGVNPSSTKEVAAALAARYPGRSFTGPGGTADNVLAELKNPALDALAEWRSLKTQVDYFSNLEKWVADLPGWDPGWGTVRTLYRQIAGGNDEDEEAGAGMGRSSSGQKDYGPNWQNTGKLQPNWKKMGLPDGRAVVCTPPGYTFGAADASQCHARVACKVSLDPFLLKAYCDNYDVHSDMAFELAQMRNLGPDWTAVNIRKWAKDKKHPNHTTAKALRNASKNCYYGSQNLQAWYTLQETCAGATDPVFLTEAECRFLIRKFKAKYAGLVAYQRRTIDNANKHNVRFDDIGIPGVYGYVVGPTGRRLYLEKLESKYTGKIEVKGTDCVSFVWMGAEADIVKRAAAIIMRDRRPEWDLRLTNCAHDELNFICKTEHAHAAARFVYETLTACMLWVVGPEVPADEEGADYVGVIVEDWSKKH